MNKRRAIRNILARLGLQAGSEQAVEALATYGIQATNHFVASVKSQILRCEAKAVREQSKRPPKIKSRNRPQQRKIVRK